MTNSDSFKAGVRLSTDALAATLVISGPCPNEPSLRMLVAAALAEKQVVVNATTRQLVELAVSAALDWNPRTPDEHLELTIARGTPPVHGTHGRLELERCDSQAAANDDQTSSIDHYSRSRIQVIKPGDVIGRIIPPIPGTDGVDVLGRCLAAKQALPAAVEHDDTIKADSEGTLIAAARGLLEVRGPKIRIIPRLEIPAFVDFSTGNVDFPGDVVVRKGVRDRFSLIAAGSVEIFDLVEGATIECGNDALLHRGMAGKERGRIVAGRDLQANHFSNVSIHAGRDLTVVAEIANCETRVRRCLRAGSCSLVGGELTVAGPAELATVGSESAVATHLILGRDHAVETLLRQLVQMLPAIEENAAKAKERLAQVKSVHGRLAHNQAELITELEFEENNARRLIPITRDRMASLLRTLDSFSATKLTIHRTVFPGTVLWMGTWRVEITTPLRGPLRFTLDESGSPVLSESSSTSPRPLNSIAKVRPDERFLDLAKIRRSLGSENRLAA